MGHTAGPHNHRWGPGFAPSSARQTLLVLRWFLWGVEFLWVWGGLSPALRLLPPRGLPLPIHSDGLSAPSDPAGGGAVVSCSRSASPLHAAFPFSPFLSRAAHRGFVGAPLTPRRCALRWPTALRGRGNALRYNAPHTALFRNHFLLSPSPSLSHPVALSPRLPILYHCLLPLSLPSRS